MSAKLKGLFASVVTGALVAMGGSEFALAAGANPPHRTRFLSPTGEVLPDAYRPNPQSTTYFVIHGFRASGRDEASLRLAGAIGRRFPDANVIIVDWSVSSPPQAEPEESLWKQLLDIAAQYQQAVSVSKDVGNDIAGWMKENGVRPAATVMCGHSLGAQIAGFAGQECARSDPFGQRVWAILAADPAGPRFAGESPENRLDQADANEVIVIHATEWLGDRNTIGTVDFYLRWPETGTPNPCEQHSQAHELLTESFLQSGMAIHDGLPFGVNALGSDSMGAFSFELNGAIRNVELPVSFIAAD